MQHNKMQHNKKPSAVVITSPFALDLYILIIDESFVFLQILDSEDVIPIIQNEFLLR